VLTVDGVMKLNGMGFLVNCGLTELYTCSVPDVAAFTVFSSHFNGSF
jgi:hypothetical protein